MMAHSKGSSVIFFLLLSVALHVYSANEKIEPDTLEQLFERYGGKNEIGISQLQSLLEKFGLSKNDASGSECITANSLLQMQNLDSLPAVNKSQFIRLCPAVLYQLDSEACRGGENSPGSRSRREASESSGKQEGIEGKKTKVSNSTRSYNISDIKPRVWIASFVAIFIISIVGLMGVAMVPLVQKLFYNHVIQYLVALAVGSLTGDAFLHLLPHAIVASVVAGLDESVKEQVDEKQTVYKGLIALGGVYFFFMAEKLLSLVSEHRAEKKAEEEERRRELLNPRKSNARRLSSLTGGKGDYVHKDSALLRRLSRAANADDEILTVGLGSKALRSIDTLRRFTETDIEEEDDEAEQNEVGDGMTLTVPGAKGAADSTESSQKQSEVECITIVVPQAPKTHKPKTPEAKKKLPAVDEEHHSHASDGKNSRKHSHDDGGQKSGKSHGHGHSHEVPESIAAVAWMVVFGDGLHNFSDGLAIGAAFAQGLSGGLSTAVAVFCHELPHELGDFAVLLKTGMRVRQALFYNVVSSCLCFTGMIIGIAIGNVESASFWIFAIAGGMFIYIALVDMLPELGSANVKPGESRIAQFFIQVAGIATGVSIMLTIALYEDKIKESLDLGIN